MTRLIYNGNNVPEAVEYYDISLVGKSEYDVLEYAYEVLSGYLDPVPELTLYMFDESGNHITDYSGSVFNEVPYAAFVTTGPMEMFNDRCYFVPSENFKRDKPGNIKQVDGNEWVSINNYMAYIDAKANSLPQQNGYVV
ncbi:hypothetical protein GGI20_003297 [Coemansia sp. BCRC 34301]|nr:hypothetical protein GGI20_003297 [Coemansia sp. BCRC 34301]